MLYHLLPSLEDLHIVFNLFNYITVRSAGAMATTLILTLLLGRRAIAWLKSRGIVDVPGRNGHRDGREDGAKANMGGLLIVAVTTLSTLLWAELANPYTITALVVMLWMGSLGFLDDYFKVVRHTPKGLVERYKWAGSLALGLGLGLFLVLRGPDSTVGATTTNLPLFDEWQLVFTAPAYLLWVTLVLAGSTHAVNMTDGLDGLAPGLVAIATGTFGVFAYVIGRVDTSAYLGLFYLPGAGELAVFAAAITGAALGFLWYNAQPAQVIMGDTGSLAMGGALGAMAVLLKAELLLLAVGGVFAAEAASVIIQRRYFKYTKRRYGEGRRVFRCAPIHHHFQMAGWKNEQVVVRFWILGILCAMVGFATLKLR